MNLSLFVSINFHVQCAFGLETNSFKDQDNELMKHGKDVFEGIIIKSTFVSTLINVLRVHDGLMKIINILPEGMVKLWNLTKRVQDQRLAAGVERGDFIDRLNELNKKVVAGEFPTITSEQVSSDS